MNELWVGAAALQAGIPTAAVLAAIAFRVAGPFDRGYLITRELSGCKDLPAFLNAARDESSEETFRTKELFLHGQRGPSALCTTGAFTTGT